MREGVAVFERSKLAEQRADPSFIPVDQKVKLRVFLSRQREAADHDTRGVVTPHGINRQGQTHACCRSRSLFG